MRSLYLIISITLSITLLSISTVTYSQEHSGYHKNHRDTVKESSAIPTPKETGQSAFAAIAEIVSLLESDPNTDWSTVNISALREHLVDMNLLTLNSHVVTSIEQQQVTFTITGSKNTLRAIQTMVPAHARALVNITPWTLTTLLKENGVVLTITSKEPQAIQKISALGFFGIMSIGAHHQQHHLAMALGNPH